MLPIPLPWLIIGVMVSLFGTKPRSFSTSSASTELRPVIVLQDMDTPLFVCPANPSSAVFNDSRSSVNSLIFASNCKYFKADVSTSGLSMITWISTLTGI